MNILLIHQAFVSPSEAGGTRHYELSQHCLKAGHTVTIVASDLSYLTGTKVKGPKGLVFEQNIDRIRVLRSYTYPSLHRSFVWRVISFLSFMLSSIWAGLKAGPVDLVIGTSPPIFQAVSAWLIAFLRRKPFLLEIRDLWPEFAIDMGVLKNTLLIRFSRLLESFLYWRASHILVNSPAYRSYLLNRGVGVEKVSFVANGVDPDMFDPEARGEMVRKRYNLQDKFVVTYAGALGPANNISAILKAAKILSQEPNIHFLIVGDGKDRSQMENLAKELKIDQVIFAGPLPKNEMKEVLAASDVCIATLQNIPMFKTTYPNKVFDYMAAGRPTVLAIDGVIREVLDSAQGGISVEPGDASEIAAAVRRLRDDRREATAMGHRAREYVVKNFNRRIQAAAFVALVERIALGGHKAAEDAARTSSTAQK